MIGILTNVIQQQSVYTCSYLVIPIRIKRKGKGLRESSPTKLLKGWKQKKWTTSAVFLSELKRKGKGKGGCKKWTE